MTRRELMHRMGCDELNEWLAYDRIEPLPDAHWDAAMIAFVIACVNGAKGVKFENFYLPTIRKAKPRRQSGKEMAAIIRRATAAAERTKG